MAKGTTQQIIEIDQIKEGVVILRNKTLRGILMVSSINFALKSEEEQNAITFQFQNFLNSLDFSIEIVVQSKKLNITGYLEKLEELEEKEKIELLKIQIAEYRKFIMKFIKGGGIMSKQFFVIIPFSLVELHKLTAEETKQKKAASLTEERFQRARTQLWQRMEFTALGLRRCGLQSIPLNTTELIELFWSLYHPEESEVGYYPEIPPELTE